MTFVRRFDVPVVPATASGATVLSSGTLNGLLHAVEFDPSTVNPWSTAIDFTIQNNGGDILHVDLNASLGGQWFFPRRPANGTNSATFDPSGNTSGREGVLFPFADERARIVAASGGATTSGFVRFYLV